MCDIEWTGKPTWSQGWVNGRVDYAIKRVGRTFALYHYPGERPRPMGEFARLTQAKDAATRHLNKEDDDA